MNEEPKPPSLEEMQAYYKRLSKEETVQELVGWLKTHLNNFLAHGVNSRAITSALTIVMKEQWMLSEERPDLAGSFIELGGVLLTYPGAVPPDHAIPNAHVYVQIMNHILHECRLHGFAEQPLKEILLGFAGEIPDRPDPTVN